MNYPAGVNSHTIGSPMNEEEVEVKFDITLKGTVIINCSASNRRQAIEEATERARSDAIYEIQQLLPDYEIF